MPKPSIRRSMERALGKGQAGQGEGLIPGLDRVRDAGARNPRTGTPWPESSGAGYQTQTIGPISGTIAAADFDEVTAPSGVTSHGVLSVQFVNVVADTPLMTPEAEATFVDFRNNGLMPNIWGYLLPASGSQDQIGLAYIADDSGASTEVSFPVTGSGWPDSWAVALRAGATADVYAQFKLWTPTS